MDEQKQLKRYELMDNICFSVCEGNEFQTLQAVRKRNELGMPGLIRDELTEWKYDLIWQMAQITQSLRDMDIAVLTLDEIQADFYQLIFRAGDQQACRQISEEMALRFCRINTLKNARGYSVQVQRVLQLVDRDLSQPLTLQYLAGTLNVNSSYLSSLFSREMGMTLTEYVTDRRISYSANQLLKTQYPIKTIAKKAGISDVQYFSRIFKKKMGVTPSQYRRKNIPEES